MFVFQSTIWDANYNKKEDKLANVLVQLSIKQDFTISLTTPCFFTTLLLLFSTPAPADWLRMEERH